ncbi:hypothetical protein AURDEDRAFT_117054 [Auricularia subglabra TFB-10046 SS5]|nr:hypothetical protein AURDEDRAFT_117054 [Auricularia subglabra TFB-10046 SS5]
MAAQLNPSGEGSIPEDTTTLQVPTCSAQPSTDLVVGEAARVLASHLETSSPPPTCRFYDELDSESEGDDVPVAKGNDKGRKAGVPLFSQGPAPPPTRYPSSSSTMPSGGPPARPAAPRPGQTRPTTQQPAPGHHNQHIAQGGPGPATHGAAFAPARSQTPAPPRPQYAHPPPARFATPGPGRNHAPAPNPYGSQGHGYPAPPTGQARPPFPAAGQPHSQAAPPPHAPSTQNQPKTSWFGRP